ncbi:MAG: DUF4157 domain-containing protein [Myxococcota bacterium]
MAAHTKQENTSAFLETVQLKQDGACAQTHQQPRTLRSGATVEQQIQMRRRSGLTGCAVIDFVQRSSSGTANAAGDAAANIHTVAQRGVAGAQGTLPHLKQIQASFGRHDVRGVKAAIGGQAAEASQAMGAQAYATGNTVAFAQSPSVHLAAHEAAHVVQQRAGVSLKGGVGQVGDRYEQHADAVADAVVQGKSAEALLDTMAPGSAAQEAATQRSVQMWQQVGTERYGVAIPDAAEAMGVDCDQPLWGLNLGEQAVCTAQDLANRANVRTVDLPIEVGTEEEWLQPGDRMGAFLRSAVLTSDPQWEAWTYQHLSDIFIADPILRNAIGDNMDNLYHLVGHPTRELQRPISQAAKQRFARALYGGEQGARPVRNARDAELFQRFIAENQGMVVENYAQQGETMNSEPLANAANSDQRFTMIGSAGGTICAAVRRYACAEGTPNPDAERRVALRMINRAGQLIRTTVEVCDQIEAARVARVKAIMGIALAAVPLPGLSALGEFAGRAVAERVVQKLIGQTRDNLRDHYAAALASGASSGERLGIIRDRTIEEIEDLGLPTEQEADLRQELVSSIQ